MSYSRIDTIENMVMASAVMNIESAKYAVNKLDKYVFTSDSRKTIFNTLKRIVADHDEITPPIVSMNITKADMPTKSDHHLKEAQVKIFALMDMYSPVSFHKNVNELINMATYDMMAREYYSYLEDIDKGVPIKTIIAKNDALITTLVDNDLSDEEFVVTQKDIAAKMKNRSVKNESFEKVYLTKDDQIDTKLKISRRNIILIAGKNGSYKTKFMIYILKLLNSNYDNISVLHYLMEDPADKAIRAYISLDLKLSDSQILEKGYTMTLNEKTRYEELLDKVSSYDIVYVNKGVSIKEIGLEFKAFRKKRPGRFCILVVDNIMKLTDGRDFTGQNETKLDNYICSEIDSWNIKTSNDEATVFLLHHFVDAQLEPSKRRMAYRPGEKDIRGSSRYRDSATQILLMNSTGNYPDLISEYPHMPNTIKRMTMIDLIKNRNDEVGTLRYVSFPEFNSFVSLDKLIKYKDHEQV